ncbi:beta-lactamase domain-containing protein [Cavenderia fasciculata]|uniref:Beta-lactamase domain-containing protein n=1 Tax=Cavenderia fasciculata TaxID=261658 RepID=F4Q8H1_CACFS|nr:beta-lactamase domain-containing protein [Cavenderia fasciculata]EGG16071.1 beta-lactamase domain-containing protein [Cavenderia fasciculata]|eukprot:XP_004352396.1 beta-lactamase domain-containing protein [Cavenderia fasciculata]
MSHKRSYNVTSGGGIVNIGDAEEDDILQIMPIGSGSEVGRSCVLLKYKGKTIMFDCGVHPAYSGLSSLPFFDSIELYCNIDDIDLLLVSHFHLDHAAAVPYFVQKTDFKGKVYMTHPTKKIYKVLLSDYVKVSNISVAEDMPFDEQDLNASLPKIEHINYHQKIEHNGIKFCCYNAGHVLGAAMFMVEIAGVRILYTGDFSRQEDRHLMGAESPPVDVDVLIIESTYGVQVHEPRLERERRFTTSIHEIVRRGGRCLIPVFALGRAQELLLILDEYWIAHPELHGIPIYYASALAKKCMKVYQTYIQMMNERIRAQFAVSNPFIFKHIKDINGIDNFNDNGPCVFMASPGMLQSGLSRQLFERWCSDRRNGVVIPGYSVEGTLAKHIMSEPSEITRLDGINVPLNLSVTYVSFSAHSDFLQTSEFIQDIHPPHIVLVHGDANEMSRLKHSLVSKFKTVNVMTPKNSMSVRMVFKPQKVAKIVGEMANSAPANGTSVQGLLVIKDFTHTIMAPGDLQNFTNLKTNIIKQKMTIPFAQNYLLLKSTIQQLYDDVKEQESINNNNNNNNPILKIYNSIIITLFAPTHVIIEWESNPVNDMISDSVIALISQIETNPFSLRVGEMNNNNNNNNNNGDTEPINNGNGQTIKVKKEKSDDQEEEEEDEEQDVMIMTKSRKQSQKIEMITEVKSLLEHQFGPMQPDSDNPLILLFNLDDKNASIHLEDLTVECADSELKQYLENSINRIKLAVHPIAFSNISTPDDDNNNNKSLIPVTSTDNGNSSTIVNGSS